jgi:hypothetical protein
MVENNDLEPPLCLHNNVVEQSEDLSDSDNVFILPSWVKFIVGRSGSTGRKVDLTRLIVDQQRGDRVPRQAQEVPL